VREPEWKRKAWPTGAGLGVVKSGGGGEKGATRKQVGRRHYQRRKVRHVNEG